LLGKFLDLIVNIIGGENYVAIFTALTSAAAAGVIAFATWRYTNYSKQNIEKIEQQNNLLKIQNEDNFKNFQLMLLGTLDIEKKNIDKIFEILSLYNSLKFFENLKSVSKEDNNKLELGKKRRMAINNLKYIVEKFKVIDYAVKQGTTIDFIDIRFGEFFGINEEQSKNYFSILRESFENFSQIFKNNEYAMTKNLFLLVAKKRGYVNLEGLIKRVK
jgi:hypothetical protein